MKKILLPFAIIAGAVVLSLAMVSLKPAPAKLESPETAVAVETLVLKKTETQLFVQSQGTVLPQRLPHSLLSSGVLQAIQPEDVTAHSGPMYKTGAAPRVRALSWLATERGVPSAGV